MAAQTETPQQQLERLRQELEEKQAVLTEKQRIYNNMETPESLQPAKQFADDHRLLRKYGIPPNARNRL